MRELIIYSGSAGNIYLDDEITIPTPYSPFEQIRVPKGNGPMPTRFGPAYNTERTFELRSINIEWAGFSAGFSITVEGDTVSPVITQTTTFPYTFPVPIIWTAGNALSVRVTSSGNLDEWEALIKAVEI